LATAKGKRRRGEEEKRRRGEEEKRRRGEEEKRSEPFVGQRM
jgi:hypothetical protein